MKTYKDFITLRYHNKLNPLLWTDDKLNPGVKDKLLEIAYLFKAYCNILPNVEIKDIVITGGNVNYNYTRFSDIDVHLVIDYKEMNIGSFDSTKDYFLDKKNVWKKANPDVKIFGFGVEPFFQDITQIIPRHQGIYSILNDKWVLHPTNIDFVYTQDLIDKVNVFKHNIDRIISINSLQQAEIIKDEITEKRSSGLATPLGEFSEVNLIFKELRNDGYLQKLSDFIKAKTAEQLSSSAVN